MVSIHVWEQLATDQPDPWQVVLRLIFTPYDCLLISVVFVSLCRVGCLWVTGVCTAHRGRTRETLHESEYPIIQLNLVISNTEISKYCIVSNNRAWVYFIFLFTF